MYYYKSDYIPEKEAVYRVEVSYSDYTPISAETYIPGDIVLYNIDVDTTSSEDKIGLTFSFDDNANQQNYYRLKEGREDAILMSKSLKTDLLSQSFFSSR